MNLIAVPKQIASSSFVTRTDQLGQGFDEKKTEAMVKKDFVTENTVEVDMLSQRSRAGC